MNFLDETIKSSQNIPNQKSNNNNYLDNNSNVNNSNKINHNKNNFNTNDINNTNDNNVNKYEFVNRSPNYNYNQNNNQKMNEENLSNKLKKLQINFFRDDLLLNLSFKNVNINKIKNIFIDNNSKHTKAEKSIYWGFPQH